MRNCGPVPDTLQLPYSGRIQRKVRTQHKYLCFPLLLRHFFGVNSN